MIKLINGLEFEDGRSIFFDEDRVCDFKKELEVFLRDEKEMNTLKFSKKVMHSQEIKTNNTIEGYLDDVRLIEKVIQNSNYINDTEKKNRIINLYKGYKFILERNELNKDNLKKLYDILAKDLLTKDDALNMGTHYREGEVFIFFSDNVQIEPDRGVSCNILDDCMEKLFYYLNDSSDLDTMTDYYIKSQIAHFYFIYLHPYFDLNGRTARTTAMWYLLNNKAYPYIIFNRAIQVTKKDYYNEIRRVKQSHNITSFIKYLMLNTKIELEKEYVLQAIKSSTTEKLDVTDFSTLLNILSMKGLKTLKDFSYSYNLKNDKKKISDIYDSMIHPLLDKGIIVKSRDTMSMYDGDKNNFVFDINKDRLDIDKDKIKRLVL